jgi:hypothetical protein
MNIEFKELIGEPIVIMCFHKSTLWSDTIKLHLKNSLLDVKIIFQGTKVFIITLNEGKTMERKNIQIIERVSSQ